MNSWVRTTNVQHVWKAYWGQNPGECGCYC